MRTALTRACEDMFTDWPGVFTPDEKQREIKVNLPFYKAVLFYRPYTTKVEIKKDLRRCIKKGQEIFHVILQNKLF